MLMLSVCPSVHLSVACLLLFTYPFKYVSLNWYGKRNSHSKDRDCKDGPIAGGPSTAAPSCFTSGQFSLQNIANDSVKSISFAPYMPSPTSPSLTY